MLSSLLFWMYPMEETFVWMDLLLLAPHDRFPAWEVYRCLQKLLLMVPSLFPCIPRERGKEALEPHVLTAGPVPWACCCVGFAVVACLCAASLGWEAQMSPALLLLLCTAASDFVSYFVTHRQSWVTEVLQVRG